MTIKDNTGSFGCFQHRRAGDESDQLRYVEHDIIEEGYIQFVESRGIDAGHEIVQVFAVPFEVEICENG